jgi:hypothetical protein
MSNSKLAFQNKKTEFRYNFSGEKVTSDGGLLVLSKILKRNKLVKWFSSYFNDSRHPSYIQHKYSDLLTTRLLLLCAGYEDCNDINHLQHDPAAQSLFNSLPSQSTLSRFENAMNLGQVSTMAQGMIDYYVDNLSPNRKDIIIDVDCTDDPTHGKQQGSLFHGYHWQYQYNQLFYLDGQTGQIIFPVLRPGNSHTALWNEKFLRLIVKKIEQKYPHIQVHIRADAGYSNPEFYECVEELDLGFCIGIPSNQRLKALFEDKIEYVRKEYVDKEIEHQSFIGPIDYKAESWETEQSVYAKIESTGRGLNVRYYVSNYTDVDAEELYKEHYVLRGEGAENRIKEIKNYCYSDRLSCSKFSANYLRLIMSCLSYELLRTIKEKLPKISLDEKITRWNVKSIRLYLIKVAAQVRITTKRVYFRFARGHPYTRILDRLLRFA